MKKKILIFAATYNEAENIEQFLNIILKLNINLDILIVDDSSPDKTWEIVGDYEKKNDNIILIKREGNVFNNSKPTQQPWLTLNIGNIFFKQKT